MCTLSRPKVGINTVTHRSKTIDKKKPTKPSKPRMNKQRKHVTLRGYTCVFFQLLWLVLIYFVLSLKSFFLMSVTVEM